MTSFRSALNHVTRFFLNHFNNWGMRLNCCPVAISIMPQKQSTDLNFHLKLRDIYVMSKDCYRTSNALKFLFEGRVLLSSTFPKLYNDSVTVQVCTKGVKHELWLIQSQRCWHGFGHYVSLISNWGLHLNETIVRDLSLLFAAGSSVWLYKRTKHQLGLKKMF